jgi:hypothetical protein
VPILRAIQLSFSCFISFASYDAFTPGGILAEVPK